MKPSVKNQGSGSPQIPSKEAIHRILKSIQSVNDAAAENALVGHMKAATAPTILSFVNAHAINLAWNNGALQNAFLKSDYILRDGIGVEIVMPWFQMEPGLNMCGTDFIPRLIKEFKGRTIAIFGTQDPWLSNATQIITADGGNVVCTSNGFQDSEHYLALADTHKPDLIVLAMGMPKQELLSARLKETMTTPTLIVNGGAVIDFIGGKVSRAPEFVRRVKLEWAYRLMLEPKRLFERYVVGNPLFLSRCAALSRSHASPQLDAGQS